MSIPITTIILKPVSFLLPTKSITNSSNNNPDKLVRFNSYRFHRPNVSSPATPPPRSVAFVVTCSNSSRTTTNRRRKRRSDSSSNQEMVEDDSLPLDCVGTGLDVECVVTRDDGDDEDELLILQQPPSVKKSRSSSSFKIHSDNNNNNYYNDDNDILPQSNVSLLLDWTLLISPFFFWGTAMVAMKDVLPKAGPFFVASFRLLPAGLLLVAFALSTGRKLPSGPMAWLSISLFALVDATCFQGFLALGLQKTSAGLGSVIIDSQPLTVAVLAAFLFGESIGAVGVIGLVLGVVGLLLLEVPVLSLEGNDFSLWGSGEWWMLLAAQSMAVGTVMVRWVSKYSDPIMATGWHMVIGGIPLLVVSILNHDPVISGSLKELSSSDLLAFLYMSFFGSAISYGVYFYNATRGSLTKLSSLTFLTPMFASVFGFVYLGETFSPLQLVGALVTVVSIYLVNYRISTE